MTRRSLLLLVAVIILFLMLPSCAAVKGGSVEMSMDGQSVEMRWLNISGDDLGDIDEKAILWGIEESLKRPVDRFRILLDEERVATLKQKEKGLQIDYGTPRRIDMQSYGEIEIRQILIPITGDLAPAPDSEVKSVLTLVDDSWIMWAVNLPNLLPGG